MKRIIVVLLALIMIGSVAVAEGAYVNIGDYNETVLALHKKLSDLGYYGLRPESPWSTKSSDALRLVQKVLGWNATGTVENKEQYEQILSLNLTGINLLINANSPQLGSSDYENGNWRAASGGSGLREVVEIKDAPDEGTVTGFHIKGSAEDTANTDVAIDNVPVKYGDTYVMSCYAKGTGRIGIQHGKGPYIKEEFDVCDEWKRYETEFVIGDSDGSTVMSPATNVYFGVPAGVESDVVICGMIMVKK